MTHIHCSFDKANGMHCKCDNLWNWLAMKKVIRFASKHSIHRCEQCVSNTQ